MQTQIKLFYNNISATINYTLNDKLTIQETKKDISTQFDIAIDKITLIISNQSCVDNYKIESYKKIYPNKNFFILLFSRNSKDFVDNFRFIKKLNGHYEQEEWCVICLDKKPNVAISNCYHDTILCDECVKKIKVCPFCNNIIKMFEQI